MSKGFWEHVCSTLSILPQVHSAQISPSRLASLSYAVAGLLYVLRYAKNARIQALATLSVVLLGLWLSLSRLEWALLTLLIALNWFAEVANTSLEAAVNLASPGYHPMAQVAKDVAAGGSLLMALTSVIVGLLVLGPPLWERLVA
ncbi:MAG: diacylglycerol kinase family protein [Anaerolineae bacterium]|nr:diacylglycerol kinase family protein [Anaerolineae bacterium]